MKDLILGEMKFLRAHSTTLLLVIRIEEKSRNYLLLCLRGIG